MTCIAGIVDGRDVVIGADSAGVDGWSITVRADQKVFVRDGLVFGFTSSFRMGQLLRYNLTIGEVTSGAEELDRWMSTTFIDAVRSCLLEGGFAKKEHGVEVGGTFLVGVPGRHAGASGRLYLVGDDFQVGRSVDPYAACGAGEMIALGALHSLHYSTTTKIDAAEMVNRALRAADRFSPYVCAPFYVVRASE